MRHFLWLFPILFIACSNEPKSIIGASEAELYQQNGSPQYSSQQTGNKYVGYKNAAGYEISGGIVTASFREPKDNEITLSYWTQKWPTNEVTFSSPSPNPHGDTVQIKNSRLGTAILFNRATNRVERIIQFQGQSI